MFTNRNYGIQVADKCNANIALSYERPSIFCAFLEGSEKYQYRSNYEGQYGARVGPAGPGWTHELMLTYRV